MCDEQNWHILLVDDDEDDYLITRDMLAENHTARVTLEWVSTFKAGQAAISQPFDAALIDYDLGPYTGLELIREAVSRRIPYPLILLTGRGSHEVDVEAMQAGATMYLTKGEVNALLLERIIRYAIEMKQKERALRRNAERQTLLLDVTQKILTAGPNRVALTQTIFDMVKEHLDADICVNYQLDDAQGPMSLVAGIGMAPETRKVLRRLELGQAFCGTVAATRQPLAADDQRIQTDEKGVLVRSMGVHAYACHPLFARDGRVIGTLSLGSTRRTAFAPEEINFMQTLCHFLALAWEGPEERQVSRTQQIWASPTPHSLWD